jgi:hypothetical protein
MRQDDSLWVPETLPLPLNWCLLPEQSKPSLASSCVAAICSRTAQVGGLRGWVLRAGISGKLGYELHGAADDTDVTAL